MPRLQWAPRCPEGDKMARLLFDPLAPSPIFKLCTWLHLKHQMLKFWKTSKKKKKPSVSTSERNSYLCLWKELSQGFAFQEQARLFADFSFLPFSPAKGFLSCYHPFDDCSVWRRLQRRSTWKMRCLKCFSADFKKICRAANCLQEPQKSFKCSEDPGIFLLPELQYPPALPVVVLSGRMGFVQVSTRSLGKHRPA